MVARKLLENDPHIRELFNKILNAKNNDTLQSLMNEISNEIENSVNFIDKQEDSFSHRAEKTGKSKIHRITYELSDGKINISCFEWSNEIKDDLPWRDTLQVSIGSNIFFDWLVNEAYK